MYEVAKGRGVGTSFNILDKNVIKKVLDKPWSNDNKAFSSRIWENQERLKQQLDTTFTQGIMQGKSIDKMTKDLQKVMDVERSKAERLIRTEASAIQNQATLDCYEELGIDKIQILGTLDRITCPTCGAMDMQILNEKDAEQGITIPPFHPYCRCTTTPYDEDWDYEGTRIARDKDGNSYYVSEKMSYDEWKDEYINKNVENSAKSDIIGTNIKFDTSASARPYEIVKSREERLKIVERGSKEERPIFSYDTEYNYFPSLARDVEPLEGYFDVAMHGGDTWCDFFGDNIDAYTLANILRQRDDYKMGMKIRLLSCSTGNTENTGNCFAQILANELHVEVIAPTDTLYLNKVNGKVEMWIGKFNNGEMKPFAWREDYA